MLDKEELLKLRKCADDTDFAKLGYTNTVGQLVSIIDCKNKTVEDNLERLWVYNNPENNNNIIVFDDGNYYSHYICEYIQEADSSVIKNMIRSVMYKGINGKLGICKECGTDITEKDETLPDYPGLYECSKCYHPHCKDEIITDFNLNDLEKAPIGTVIGMGCQNCEGLEEHKKIDKDTWECLNCGYIETLNYEEEVRKQGKLNAECKGSYSEVKPYFEILGECSEEFASILNNTPDLRKADGEIVQLPRNMTEVIEKVIEENVIPAVIPIGLASNLDENNLTKLEEGMKTGSGKTCHSKAVQNFINK